MRNFVRVPCTLLGICSISLRTSSTAWQLRTLSTKAAIKSGIHKSIRRLNERKKERHWAANDDTKSSRVRRGYGAQSDERKAFESKRPGPKDIESSPRREANRPRYDRRGVVTSLRPHGRSADLARSRGDYETREDRGRNTFPGEPRRKDAQRTHARGKYMDRDDRREFPSRSRSRSIDTDLSGSRRLRNSQSRTSGQREDVRSRSRARSTDRKFKEHFRHDSVNEGFRDELTPTRQREDVRSRSRARPNDRKFKELSRHDSVNEGFHDELTPNESSEPTTEATRNSKRSSLRDSPSNYETIEAQPKARRTNVPVAVPYTTAASQFLYGASAVIAGLKARRRKPYSLYLHQAAGKSVNGKQGTMNARKLALSLGVPVHDVDDGWLPILDKMSSGRPHNGCVLEASPLPEMSVVRLSEVSLAQDYFNFDAGEQSAEDAALFMMPNRISYQNVAKRHPFVLLLDGVLDPGNLGAIVRSAYFLGVDAVVISANASAPLSSVAIKASSGAAEALPILRVARPEQFLEDSSKNGWRVYSAAAPPPSAKTSKDTSLAKFTSTSNIVFSPTRRAPAGSAPFTRSVAPSPLLKHPCILMLGNEGTGLSRWLTKKADYNIGLRSAKDINEVGVESLNVSVAAALLAAEFLRDLHVHPRSTGQIYPAKGNDEESLGF